MIDYTDNNSSHLELIFKSFTGGALGKESIRFFKYACKKNNLSYIYNFYSIFEQINVRNLLVSKPEILNELIQNEFFELAIFLLTETNFSTEELECLDSWVNLDNNHKQKIYIKECLEYKNDILDSVTYCHLNKFKKLFGKIKKYPKISSLPRLIANKIVQYDDQKLKLAEFFIKSKITKKLYPDYLFYMLNIAVFKERENFIKFLIFDCNMERNEKIEPLIKAITQYNLDQMFKRRDLYLLLDSTIKTNTNGEITRKI